MEAAKEDDAVLVRQHAVPGAGAGPALAGQVLPGPVFQIQAPQVPVVLELLLQGQQSLSVPWNIVMPAFLHPPFSPKASLRLPFQGNSLWHVCSAMREIMEHAWLGDVNSPPKMYRYFLCTRVWCALLGAGLHWRKHSVFNLASSAPP